MNDVLALYAGSPLSARAFIRGRILLSDLEFIERFVPDAGDILDLGCGHGLFSNLMAIRAPRRHVTGIDISEAKVEEARRTLAGRSNIEFIRGDIDAAGDAAFDAIAIIDVLYLLPRAEQLRVLSACRRKLRPDGLLVWKAQERRPRWKFAWTYLQEFIMTSAGLTKGRRDRLTFMSREQSLEVLAAAGFHARSVEMKSRRPYSDILYLGRPGPG